MPRRSQLRGYVGSARPVEGYRLQTHKKGGRQVAVLQAVAVVGRLDGRSVAGGGLHCFLLSFLRRLFFVALEGHLWRPRVSGRLRRARHRRVALSGRHRLGSRAQCQFGHGTGKFRVHQGYRGGILIGRKLQPELL